MARLIDADLAIAKVKDDGILGAGYSDSERIDDVCDMIDSCPTVDAVEVVRCKDCKHFDENIGKCYVFCDNEYEVQLEVDRDHYCSYGERGNDG